MTMKKIFYLISVISLLVGCTVGPDYKRPPVQITSHFKEAPRGWKIADPSQAFNHGEWWKIFKDPELNHLEDELNHANQNILAAEANYKQALAVVNEIRSNYFPVFGATAIITRQNQGGGSFVSNSSNVSGSNPNSSSSTTSGTINATSIGNDMNSHALAFSASWEPDIWGATRRAVEASQSNADSTGALLAATRLSMQGSLAQLYFQLRTLDKDQALLNRTVTDYKKTLKITRSGFRSGTAGDADVVQAKTQVENAESLAINNKIKRAQYEHAIAVLIGKAPANFSIPFKPLTQTPPSIPLAVPSALLERRPDIAQAERLMSQANAQIGVAISAYFPNLSLSGNAVYRHSGLFNNWFSMPDLGWSIGPQLAQTIFDGGLRSATVSAAKAGYIASVATYRQSVLTAFQDVEDNLVSLKTLQKQYIVQEQAAKNAKRALQITINQYQAGIVAYSNVIASQITAFNAEKSAADTAGLEMTSAVGLIKALGGGWDGRYQ